MYAWQRIRARTLAQLRRLGCGGYRSAGYSGSKGRSTIFVPMLDARTVARKLLLEWGATEVMSSEEGG